MKAGVVAQLAADLEAQGVTDEDAAEALAAIATNTVNDPWLTDKDEPRDVALLAHIIVQRWAVSSNDADPMSLAIQEIAARGVGINANPSSKAADFVRVADMSSSSSSSTGLQQRAERIANDSKVAAVVGAALQAQYDRTQEYLQARGILSVTLYRGLLHPQLAEARREAMSADPKIGAAQRRLQNAEDEAQKIGNQLRLGTKLVVDAYPDNSSDALDEMRELSDQFDEANQRVAEAKVEYETLTKDSVATRARVALRPLSAFSTDVETATDFSAGSGGKESDRIVVSADVKVRQIYSLPLTGSGCLGEHEVVVTAPSLVALYADVLDWRAVYPKAAGAKKPRIISVDTNRP